MTDSARDTRICVLGLGYIGLPTAGMFATHGYRVLGVDVNPRVVAALSAGTVHIEEPGLNAFIQAALHAGSLSVSQSVRDADVFIIAVPTPVAGDGHAVADLGFVAAAARSIAGVLRPGNLVILESTSPPGTTRDLVLPLLEASGLRAGRDFSLAYCAERVIPGRILLELVENDRVIGGIDRPSAERARDLYASFVQGQIFLTDSTTAEMVKLMENTFRDVNIALANEFARVADHVGIDVHEAIMLANRHPRVRILSPGPGVGGHCIAVDPWFIANAAPDVTPLIRTARAVNDSQPRYVVDLVSAAVADIRTPVIAVLGLSYKADVDDLRESPALEVVRGLQERGYAVRCHDPYVVQPPPGISVERDIQQAVSGAHAIVILTDHAPYRALKPWDEELRDLSARRLVDARHCLDLQLWRSEGFSVYGVGDRSESRDRHTITSEREESAAG